MPGLAPPGNTGILAIDSDATKLHAAAVGAPIPRRGPAATGRRRRHVLPENQPGDTLAALAGFLHSHTEGGALRRRVHGN